MDVSTSGRVRKLCVIEAEADNVVYGPRVYQEALRAGRGCFFRLPMLLNTTVDVHFQLAAQTRKSTMPSPSDADAQDELFGSTGLPAVNDMMNLLSLMAAVRVGPRAEEVLEQRLVRLACNAKALWIVRCHLASAGNS